MNNIQVRRYQNTDAKHIAEIYYNTIHLVNIKDYSEEQVNAWAPSSSIEDYSGWKKN